MEQPFELWVALRYLKARRGTAFISLITWLSVGGVAVGVAALGVVFSVMTGFEQTLQDKILGANAHVMVSGMGGPIEDPAAAVAGAEAVAGVRSATPVVYAQVMLGTGGTVEGAVVRGVPFDGDRPPPLLQRFLVGGDLAGLTARGGLVLGTELAKKLGVAVGDVVQVMVPRGSVPTIRPYRVAGRFSSGMYDLDSGFAFLPLAATQDLLQLGHAVTNLELRLDDVYAARQVARQVEQALGPRYWVRDWMEMNRILFRALKLQKTTLSLILALIVVVAAFNVAATLIMVVMEKNREIGILKSLGATNRSIRRLFAMEGMLIGTVGATAGLVLGLAICAVLHRYPIIKIPGDVYYVDHLPVSVQPGMFALIAAGALALCYLATLYPCWQASRLDPVEIIRSE
ncbi:MAG: ABC transporter permease [Deferrisomatales bacterium]|nr:ABC transporter permease [Deferrisomatales bacterium]